MTVIRRTGVACAALLLSACATTALPPETPPVVAPAQWHAPLPHAGALSDLRQWWQQFNDPVLVTLIDAAQAASPTVAAARARIVQARASTVDAQAVMAPLVNGTAGISRGNAENPGNSPLTLSQLGVQASWEIDLFGANRQAADAAQARWQGAQAQWHEARVSVAAEVAQAYFNRRSCERLLVVARADATSRSETARLAELSAKAGFTAPATASLARASAAEARARQTQQQAQCDTDIKALVGLSALEEPKLRQKLSQPPVAPMHNAIFSIAQLPAQVVSQRPDVFQAERELVAAGAEVGYVRAQNLPRLSLTGAVSTGAARLGGRSTNFQTWSLGPLQLSLPILDGGRYSANLDAARAAYDNAAAQYTARVRNAVREVEEALVNLQSTVDRDADAALATEGYRASFSATEARYKAGLASLVELEEARRTALAAETALIGLQRERTGAWIALYRAAGGGWSADTNALAPSTAARTTPVTAAATASASAAPAATRP